MPDREDERADRVIRDAFAATARPSLSPYFDSRLQAVLAEERLRRRAAITRMRIMQAYWLVAGMVVVLALATLPWSESPGGARFSVLVVTVVLAVPLVLFRVDPVELILGSAERLRGRL